MERSRDSRPYVISNASCRIEISDKEHIRQFLDSDQGYVKTLFSETYDQSLSPISSLVIDASRYDAGEPSHISSEIQHTGLKKEDRQAFMRQCAASASQFDYQVHADNYGLLFIDMPDATITVRFDEHGHIAIETAVENGHDDYDHLARLSAVGTGTTMVVEALLSVSATAINQGVVEPGVRNQYDIRLALTEDDDQDQDPVQTIPEKAVPWQYEHTGAIEFDTRRGLDAIGGLEYVKERLRENIAVIQRPDVAMNYDICAPSHLLLHGPPGTGKTNLARRFSEELDAQLIEIRASDIVDKFIGNSSKALRQQFTKAKKNNKLKVIFFDEFESIGSVQQTDNSERGSVIKELIQQLNDISESHPNIIVIAASNADMDDISPALIRSGRLEPLAVPAPNEQERRDIWAAVMLRDTPDHPDDIKAFTPYANDIDIIELAHISDGLTGADFVTILQRARKKKFMHAVTANHYTQVSHADLVTEIKNLHRR